MNIEEEKLMEFLKEFENSNPQEVYMYGEIYKKSSQQTLRSVLRLIKSVRDIDAIEYNLEKQIQDLREVQVPYF